MKSLFVIIYNPPYSIDPPFVLIIRKEEKEKITRTRTLNLHIKFTIKRILINDYNEANPFPRAIAVNIKRDHETLGDYL
jgi:hypothetical protein